MKVNLELDNINVLKDIVERIQFFRNKLNLSARNLSLSIGKNGGYINKLECLDFNITITTLYEIIDALKIEPEEFFAKNYKTYQLDKDLYDIINTMSYDKKQSLLLYIKTK